MHCSTLILMSSQPYRGVNYYYYPLPPKQKKTAHVHSRLAACRSPCLQTKPTEQPDASAGAGGASTAAAAAAATSPSASGSKSAAGASPSGSGSKAAGEDRETLDMDTTRMYLQNVIAGNKALVDGNVGPKPPMPSRLAAPKFAPRPHFLKRHAVVSRGEGGVKGSKLRASCATAVQAAREKVWHGGGEWPGWKRQTKKP